MNIPNNPPSNNTNINIENDNDLNNDVLIDVQQNPVDNNVTPTDDPSAEEDYSYCSSDFILGFSVPAIALGVTLAVAIFYNPWDYL